MKGSDSIAHETPFVHKKVKMCIIGQIIVFKCCKIAQNVVTLQRETKDVSPNFPIELE